MLPFLLVGLCVWVPWVGVVRARTPTTSKTASPAATAYHPPPTPPPPRLSVVCIAAGLSPGKHTQTPDFFKLVPYILQGMTTSGNGMTTTKVKNTAINIREWHDNSQSEVERSSSGRTDLAIHFQPSWPTTSECFSYPYAVSKFIQLRHRPRENAKNARWLTLSPWGFYTEIDNANQCQSSITACSTGQSVNHLHHRGDEELDHN